MAELLDPSEIMFTPFEPKTQNRFIMYIEGIPAFTIKAMNRPSIQFDEVILEHINVKRYVKGKGAWQPLEITLYDPVVPSAAQSVMEWIREHHESVTGRQGYSDFYKRDITFNLLGPVGDIVEEWTLKGRKKMGFSEIFKDKNEYNEKSIIGFMSFAVMTLTSIVDMITGAFGSELVIQEFIYNSFVIITLGCFGIAGAEKIFSGKK